MRAPFHELVSLVAAGLGVGLMADAIAARHGLVRVQNVASTTALKRSVWILTHPERSQVPRIATVLRELGVDLAAAFAAR